jgi:hypothetical protein
MMQEPRTEAIAPISPLCDDPNESKAIGLVVESLLASGAIPDEPRLTRHLEWLAKPNITLEKACWLLLGFDPWFPPKDNGSSSASPSQLHKRLVDCLECEVAEKRLKPVKARRAAQIARFRLLDIATMAQALEMSSAISAEILAAALGRPPAVVPETLPQRTARRLNWHRQYIESIPSERKTTAPPRPPRESLRRANPGPPLNIKIDMKSPEYDLGFERFVTHQFGRPPDDFHPKMLKDDRQSINVQLARGRHRPVNVKQCK